MSSTVDQEVQSLGMSTLGERVNERDRDLFVGRQRELARFDQIVTGDPVHVVHVSGVGGIGKSSLDELSIDDLLILNRDFLVKPAC